MGLIRDMMNDGVPEILPLLSQALPCESLKCYLTEIRSILQKIIPSDLCSFLQTGTCSTESEQKENSNGDGIAAFGNALPLVNWEENLRTPGIFSIYLLCKSRNSVEMQGFFFDMISRWLIPGQMLSIISSRNLSFCFVGFEHESFFVSELRILVNSEKDFLQIKNSLPILSKEISMGVASGDHARHILESKGLSKEQKTALIHKNFVALMHRRPKDIESDVFLKYNVFYCFAMTNLNDFAKSSTCVASSVCIIYFAKSFAATLMHFQSNGT